MKDKLKREDMIINSEYNSLNLILAGLIFFFATGKISAQKKELAFIDVAPELGYAYDSVQFKFWKEYYPYMEKHNLTKAQSFKIDEKGHFGLDDMEGRGLFFCLVYAGGEIFSSPFCPISPGDNIKLTIGSEGMAFSGKGALKMMVAYQLDRLHKQLREDYYDKADSQHTENTFWNSARDYFSKPLDSLLQVKLDYLNKYKKQLIPDDYIWLKSATISYDYYRRFVKFVVSKDNGLLADSSKAPLFAELYLKYLKHLSIKDIPDRILASTPSYLDVLLMQRSSGAKFDPDFPKAYKDIISFATTLSPVIMDQFITAYLLNKEISKLDEAEVDRAISNISSPAQRTFLTSLRGNITVGTPAYNFELEDTEGKVVRLSDFKDKVVFMDFWFTGCVWCKRYYADKLKAVEEHFRGNKNIVFLSISVDAKKSMWLNSIKGGEYNGESTVNLYTRGNGYQDSLLLHYNVKGYPTQIVVDQELNNYNINQVRKMSADELISYLDAIIKKNSNLAVK